MKKIIVFLMILSCLLGMVGCASSENDKVEDDPVGTYEPHLGIRETRIIDNGDGTWELDGITYKYRLEITGRMPNAAKSTTYIVLSNTEDITFDQTWRASGLSSNLADYFDPSVAVIVGWKLFS